MDLSSNASRAGGLTKSIESGEPAASEAITNRAADAILDLMLLDAELRGHDRGCPSTYRPDARPATWEAS